jgi:hypothetical protein
MKNSSKHMVRVLVKGGILSPSYLIKILDIVKSSGNKHLHFGSRQDMLFPVVKNQLSSLKDIFKSLHTEYTIFNHKESDAQNIVSSYVASDMIGATSWVTSSTYLNLLENFNKQPTLRINITDPKQSLVPLFYGDLNYIASTIKDYWFLYLRKNYSSLPECWPVLVLSNDIAALSGAIEENWHFIEKKNMPELFNRIQSEIKYNWRMIESKLKLEHIPPHDYEGFGRMFNSQNLWAGFYWRNNCYDVRFLEEVCHLCIRTNISKICLTPWKSFLVKDITEKDLIHWQRLLGRFGINMRHSSFELNWHLPLQDKHALKLKRYLVKKFDKVDVSVHGLTFGIKTKPEPSFCTIQIESLSGAGIIKYFDIFKIYRILYAKNFDANTNEYIEFITQVSRYRIPAILQELTIKYYMQMHRTDENQIKELKPVVADLRIVYQCINCLTIYNDKTEQIPFEKLPESYTCELCDAPKTDFRQKEFGSPDKITTQ